MVDIDEDADADVDDAGSSGGGCRLATKDVGSASWQLVKLSWPVSLGYALHNSIGVMTIFSLGHVGTKELAASALSHMFANCTGYSLGAGMATGLDTLCSQSFTGAKDKTEVGRHLQRALVVMVFLTIPVAFIWFLAEPILLLLGQDPDIARLSGLYLRYLFPSCFAYFVTEAMKRYLQCQGHMSAHMHVLLLASPINAALQWLLVFGPGGLGFIGAPLAVSITYSLVPFMLMLYIRYWGGGECWGGWRWRDALDLTQIKILLAMGFPGIIMICAEWIAFEVLTFSAGLISKESLAAASIVLSTTSLTYQIPMGVGVATSNTIGNALGARNPRLAATFCKAANVVALCVALACSVSILAVRTRLGAWYTDDGMVRGIVAGLLPYGAVYQIADALTVVGGGVLRGCGHQKIGAVVNFAGYYIIGLPISIYSAFSLGWGVYGLWFGIVLGLYSVCLCQLWIITTRIDWEKEVQRSIERLAKKGRRLLLGEEGGLLDDEEEEEEQHAPLLGESACFVREEEEQQLAGISPLNPADSVETIIEEY